MSTASREKFIDFVLGRGERPEKVGIGDITGLLGDNVEKRMISNQIQDYKKQTEITKQEIAEAKASENFEKRRVNEKQIRTLRRSYRAQGAGLLGVGNPANEDMSGKLGG